MPTPPRRRWLFSLLAIAVLALGGAIWIYVSLQPKAAERDAFLSWVIENGGEIRMRTDGSIDEIMLPAASAETDIAMAKRLFPSNLIFVENLGRVQ
jgi:hypothetical protein